ncbi:MAG: hypothetical protein LQ352_001415 [Teloschistes flavicans]|nr:MAG: hypothetical protein LQ352_001415 [Teloschistes flavicans]
MAPASSSPNRQLPQPIESTQRAQRRFAPEPIESSARSNRPAQGHEERSPETAAVRSRILPQPLESSARSSKKQDKHNDAPSAAATTVTSPSRKHLPQPIQSNKSSSRSRKYAPELVETTSRQRKRGDTLPTVLDTDKTEHDPDDPVQHRIRQLRLSRPGAQPIPPVNSPITSTDQVPQLHESRFSYANISKRASLDQTDRRHSFRVPQLPSIPSQTEESEESDGSTCTSLSTTPSAEPDNAELRQDDGKGKGKGRKASGYILSLAAQAAEKQLREQAMAAYPNERFYEPVDHFAVDREDADSDGEGIGKLSRSATFPPPGGVTPPGGISDITAPSSRQRILNGNGESVKRKNTQQPNLIGAQQKDDQMKPMHKAASPPMAGQNLKFPKCQSPRQTRVDVHQYPGAPPYLGMPQSREHSGLWTPEGSKSRQNSKNGLWMGVCAQSAQKLQGPTVIQSGLLTPVSERDDPMPSTGEESLAPEHQQLPPSPPTSIGGSKTSCIDAVLAREKAIDEEFHDGFITQVYNYLSLGYPALARKYDHELSKITHVPVENLRQDDAKANAKGYVGVPESTAEDLRGVQEGRCERWTALRLYVREWARQQPMFGAGGGLAQGGVRKGSWAA